MTCYVIFQSHKQPTLEESPVSAIPPPNEIKNNEDWNGSCKWKCRCCFLVFYLALILIGLIVLAVFLKSNGGLEDYVIIIGLVVYLIFIGCVGLGMYQKHPKTLKMTNAPCSGRICMNCWLRISGRPCFLFCDPFGLEGRPFPIRNTWICVH